MALDGKKVFGDERIIVENTHKNSGGDRRDRDRDRDRDRRRDRGSSPSGKCYGCGETGHW